MIKWKAFWYIDNGGTGYDFTIIDGVVNESLREVAYSYLTIDFDGLDESYLPKQYSVIEIYGTDENDEYVGLTSLFVDNIKYPDFSTINKPFHIELSLINGAGIVAKRTVSEVINLIPMQTALATITNPLLASGMSDFEVDIDTNINNYNVSEIFQCESIEKVLNYFCQKHNLVWYVDNYNKYLYIKNVDDALKEYIGTNKIDLTNPYLQEISPVQTTVDYANFLNIKNMRLISYRELLPTGTELLDGESYIFEYPISVSENVAYRLSAHDIEAEIAENYAFTLETTSEAETKVYQILINLDDKTITYDAKIGFDGVDNDDATKKILLITDSADVTKVLGFKWKGLGAVITADTYAGPCWSSTTLIPYTYSYLDPIEITNTMAVAATSGKIEKIVDANGKYFTDSEIQTYAISLFSQNNLITSEINATFKGLTSDTTFMTDYYINRLHIMTPIYFDISTAKVNGLFLITDNSIKLGTEVLEITVNARAKNVGENSMDIYRTDFEQENEDKLTRKVIAFYNQDEKTLLSKEVYVNGVLVND